MKVSASAAVAMALIGSHLQAEILVHEPFFYKVGKPLAGQNLGLGFSGPWADGPDTGTAFIYDQSTATTPVDNGSGTISWDGAWDGSGTVVTTMPAAPNARYVGLATAAGADKFEAYRPLARDAGTMAGKDKTLWASAIWHFSDQTYGAHIAFGLTTDSFISRGRQLDDSGKHGSGEGIGIGAAASSFGSVCNAAIFEGGKVVAEGVGARAPGDKDILVVVKFVFGKTDTVSAHFFAEGEDITEAIFDAQAVTASHAIDEAKLKLLAFDQNRGGNAIDELRVGDTFQDILTGQSEPPQPLEITKVDHDKTNATLTVTWKSNPGETYGLYWSNEGQDFDIRTNPAIHPEVPAHAAAKTTTYGPFKNPNPGVGGIFFKLGDADQEDPGLVRVSGVNNRVTLVFSEAMAEGLATDPANYSVAIKGRAPVAIKDVALISHGTTATITLKQALPTATDCKVTVNQLTDLAGRKLGKDVEGLFSTWDDNPEGIKVFILAGQSNMVGYGKTEEGGNPAWTKDGKEPKEIKAGLGCLRNLAVNDSKYPEYDYASLLVNPSQPATSPWKSRSDVKVWWRQGSSGKLGGAIGKGNLGPPFRGGGGTWFGPEFGFGQVIGDYYKSDDVLIIKAAWGGHKLSTDFRPPSAVAKRGGEVGSSYQEMFINAREVLNHLDTEFPEWAGRGYQIVGIGWHQGTSDKAPASVADEYKDNLPDFISDVRAEFGKPDLPFVIATTGMQDAGPSEAYPYTGYHAVEKAQLWVAGVDQPANVLTDDTRDYWRDTSISPSNTGFHWNHSGESYFLVGKGLGEKMMELLKAQ